MHKPFLKPRPRGGKRVAISLSRSRQGPGPFIAISPLTRRASGESPFAEGDETKRACLCRTWERVRLMIKPRKTMGKQLLTYALASVAASCLGAVVFAAPMTIIPKAKVIGPSPQSSETKPAYVALGKGPAFQLGRAAAGEDEDCVRVTRVVGPDGRVRHEA
jgi:hypothetical protein